MEFYVSTVSVCYIRNSWFFKKRMVEELVSVGISTGQGYPLIVSIKGVNYDKMYVSQREFVLNSLRADHELDNWGFDDFESHISVSEEKAAALISSYINHFAGKHNTFYALRPQDNWHLIKDLIVSKNTLSQPLCFSVDQMFLDALYKEKIENLDRGVPRNMIRDKEFPKSHASYCRENLAYTIALHKFLKKHA